VQQIKARAEKPLIPKEARIEYLGGQTV
jgi:hypothetical protein